MAGWGGEQGRCLTRPGTGQLGCSVRKAEDAPPNLLLLLLLVGVHPAPGTPREGQRLPAIAEPAHGTRPPAAARTMGSEVGVGLPMVAHSQARDKARVGKLSQEKTG